ncbi:IclR family transcriptional regulator [Bacteroides timonensis]|uniref:IclR family transcriptional regulator n=1 Tax=Bacteroides timonensis TaxID=1470345 RepID=UPI0004BAB042|nr:helix-turn-helix domain-containing protein [Bacteroides timonensis]
MIQVINRAFNILEVIAHDHNKEWGLSEIADELELNHGTCANILKTLVQRGYVEQMGLKKGYKLGYMAYQLTASNEYNVQLINATKILIDSLANRLNETVILSHIKNGKRIIVYEALCNQEIQIRTTSESTAYRATTGRMILAHYSPKELKDFISLVGLPAKEDWPEITNEAELIQSLNETRKKNIEITWNSNHVVGLATPIFKKNKIIASLGVYLPDIRFSKAERNFIVKEMLQTTELINNKINSNQP